MSFTDKLLFFIIVLPPLPPNAKMSYRKFSPLLIETKFWWFRNVLRGFLPVVSLNTSKELNLISLTFSSCLWRNPRSLFLIWCFLLLILPQFQHGCAWFAALWILVHCCMLSDAKLVPRIWTVCMTWISISLLIAVANGSSLIFLLVNSEERLSLSLAMTQLPMLLLILASHMYTGLQLMDYVAESSWRKIETYWKNLIRFLRK